MNKSPRTQYPLRGVTKSVQIFDNIVNKKSPLKKEVKSKVAGNIATRNKLYKAV